MNHETLGEGLRLMLVGMVAVFAVLSLIAVMASLMQRRLIPWLEGVLGPEAVLAKPAPAPALADEVSPDTLAAITVAVRNATQGKGVPVDVKRSS